MSEPILLKLPAGALRGQPSAPARWQHPDGRLGEGTVESFAAQYQGAQVALVLSVADVQYTEVALSRRQARHLQKVLPFLLEEQVIGELDSLWFAAGAARDGRYPVIACDREAIETLKERFEDAGLNLVGAAVDAQLMQAEAPLTLTQDDQVLLVRGQGEALTLPLAQFEQTCAALELDASAFTTVDADQQWLLMRQGWRQRVELLHGALRSDSGDSNEGWKLPPGWRQFARVAAVLLLLGWSMAWLQAWQYSRLADRARAEAGSLYQSLFPGDRATAKLQGQFRNRLAQLGAGDVGSGDFLTLLTPVSASLASMRDQGMQPQRMVYEERDGNLMLDVEARNYDGLEALRNQLQKSGLSADIANFRNQGDKVAARIKVAMQ